MKRVVSRWHLATAPLRTFPHFVVIGGMKCGTTTLFYLLKDHPDFRSPIRKEIHFFDREYRHGERWYRAHFPFRSTGTSHRWVTGEASPFYLIHPFTPSRMAKLLPQARLLVLLRNPVARAYSHYQQICRMGWETLSFEDALAEEEERITPDLEKMSDDPLYHGESFRRYSYAARGRYAEQLERWLPHYSRQQILVVRSESFLKDTDEVYGKMLQFLGMRSWSIANVPNRRVANYEPMLPATKERLRAYFEPENRKLSQLLGESFDW